MTAKVSIDHLSKFYARTHALDDIHFDIGDREFVSVVGASGCGKTTLLRLLAGLEQPSEGTVSLDGAAVTAPSRKIGVVYQNDRLLPWRSVRKNISLGLELGKERGPQGADDVDALIDLVGLSDFERHYPYQLSGGMRQRANLARALATDPQLLLLDEPFAALDAQTRELMQMELLRIWDERRKTVMFITHQIDEAVFLSDRVVVLSRRPGHIREIIPIDLPRPRDLREKRTSEFNAYVERIWDLLERDMRNADREARRANGAEAA